MRSGCIEEANLCRSKLLSLISLRAFAKDGSQTNSQSPKASFFACFRSLLGIHGTRLWFGLNSRLVRDVLISRFAIHRPNRRFSQRSNNLIRLKMRFGKHSNMPFTQEFLSWF